MTENVKSLSLKKLKIRIHSDLIHKQTGFKNKENMWPFEGND